MKVSCSSFVCVTSCTMASASSAGDKWHTCKQSFHSEVDRNWISPSESPSELGRVRPGQGFCMFDRVDEEDVEADAELKEDVFGR